jgi:tetratricopeptide (TPR) repeat protein
MNLNRLEEALADNRRSQLLNPLDADTQNNLGAVLQKLGRHEETLAWYDRAAALRANFVPPLIGKAHSLIELRRIDEAFASYAQCLARDPKNPDARWGLALLQILVGNFEAGWLGCEAR